jgi:hypothetical protein
MENISNNGIFFWVESIRIVESNRKSEKIFVDENSLLNKEKRGEKSFFLSACSACQRALL